MNDFRITFDVNSPVERVWDVTLDIERWPEWTPTVTRARRRDQGPIQVGSVVQISQPRLPPAWWRITDLEPGRSVTLKSGMPGMWVHAHHFLEPIASGCRVTLSLRFSGLFAGLLARWTHDLNHRYLALEADGLKKRCES